MTAAALAELAKLLKKAPSQPNWRKVCEHLDAWPGPDLRDALAAVNAEAPRWEVDTNKRGGWELPARYTPQAWAKRLLHGDAPPAFAVARLLQLHNVKVTDDGLARLLATGALGAITHLYLGSCYLDGAALGHLARHADQLRALTHLVLTDNALAAGGLADLLAPPLAARLVALDLSYTPLDRRDLAVLLAVPLPALRRLTLSFIDATGDEVAALFEARTLPALTRLEVATRDAPALADALRARGAGQPHLLAALCGPG